VAEAWRKKGSEVSRRPFALERHRKREHRILEYNWGNVVEPGAETVLENGRRTGNPGGKAEKTKKRESFCNSAPNSVKPNVVI